MTRLDELPPTFTTGTALRSGLHRRDLYRARDEGELNELSRGVFRKAEAPEPDHPDLLAVSLRAPGAIVCCLSSAAVHDLTDEIPIAVQIAVPRRQRPPRIAYPPTQVFRFAEETFELGLTSVEAAPGEIVRVYTEERTVIDLMRLRHRLGEATAFVALRRYLGRRSARPGQLLELARRLGLSGPMRSAVDVVISE
jgi:predicted transcriptional regulator of viral defense system